MTTIDSREGTPVLTSIALQGAPEAALPSFAIEQFRALARRLDVERRAGGPSAFVVTSPGIADGRTTTALYTAVALAGRGHRVVLCDFDLRSPSLAERHGLSEQPGIADVVGQGASLDQALRVLPGTPGLTLLPAGTLPSDPALILHDPRAPRLIATLAASFDFVVCDAPPTLGVADAACLGDLVGAALLVVRAGQTSKRELGASVATLRGIKIIGCVLAGVDRFVSAPSKRAAKMAARRPETRKLALRSA